MEAKLELFSKCSNPKFVIRDTFFLSHGSPTLAIDESQPARHFLQSFKNEVFSVMPKAILVISSHWDTDEPYVNVVERNDTMYDFESAPEEMYQLKYHAPGAKEVAKSVKDVLTKSGFGPVREDEERGLDHGAWVPLMLMYPEADIPVCQLSIQSNRDATYHYNLGKALAPLREDGILIIGSGSAIHNLDALNMSRTDGGADPWAAEFDDWLTEALVSGRYDDVNKWAEKAPNARKAHPTAEHFYPLHVAMGAAGDDAKAKLIHTSWGDGVMSHSSYQFTVYDDVNNWEVKAPHAREAHRTRTISTLHVAMGTAEAEPKAKRIHTSLEERFALAFMLPVLSSRVKISAK